MAARSHGRRALSRLRAAALLLAATAVAAGAAEPPPAEELLNALLAQLLHLGEMTPPELQKVVEEAGGVPFPAPVPVEFLGYGELRAYLREVVDSEYPVREAEADARSLIAFDLVEAGIDLRRVRRGLLEQNIAGFYDERPHRRRLYVVSEDRRLTPMNQIILAHEMRHALQDQHADVHAVLPEDVGDFDDRRLAYLSLLEGDATLVMERFLRRRLEAAEAEVPDSADLRLPVGDMPGTPAVLRDQMVLPYVIGTPFAQELWRRGGWAAVQEAWRRPPDSTEQVLHPEKYWQRDRPLDLAIPYTPRHGILLREGVLGEAFLRTLLAGDEAAAAGWAGDLFRTWDLRGRTLMVWRSAWESETEAAELATAMAARYRVSHRSARPHREALLFQKGSWYVATWRQAAEVWLIGGDERRVVEKAVAELKAKAAL